MPQSTDPKPGMVDPSPSQPPEALVSAAPLSLKGRLMALLPERKKVFYDSPGMLEQSHHWGGMVIWTIAVGTTAGLIWAFLGKVDQTVSASGTLEPVAGKVVIKTTSGGIVKRLLVKEGEWVKPGEPLAEVENLGLLARLSSTTNQLDLLQYENSLYDLLIDNKGRLPGFLPEPPRHIANEDRVRSVQLTVREAASQLLQLQSRVSSQEETLALKKSLAASLRPLYDNGGMAKFTYLQSRDEIQQIRSQISQTKEQINILLSQAGRQYSANERQILNLQADRIGLQESRVNLVLRATGQGRIFNLSVRKGSVIGSGAELMRIVPEGALRAIVYLSNTDLGFVHQGQNARVAVSSFPVSEYGYLDGRVLRIGADALEADTQTQQQRANTYPLQVALGENPTKRALVSRLKPGMQVSALIVVRQRPVITLLTDTFTKGTESLKNSR